MKPRPPAPTGLRLIVAYKAVKAPVMLGLAMWLTFAPGRAFDVAQEIVAALSVHKGLLHLAGMWLGMHLGPHTLSGARALAWLDGVVTSAEAVLLWMGQPWGEWLVAGALAALVPFEALHLVRRPRVGGAIVLAINVAVVAYLVRLRLRAGRHATDGPRAPGSSMV